VKKIKKKSKKLKEEKEEKKIMIGRGRFSNRRVFIMRKLKKEILLFIFTSSYTDNKYVSKRQY
jgi:hypothetical protein